MSTARYALSGNGTTSASLAAGGNTPSVTNATEEFTGASTFSPTNKLKNYDNIQRNIWKTN